MKKLNRRQFVRRSSALTAAPLILSARAKGANDRLRVACVGVRGRGRDHIRGFHELDNVEVVALCDADQNILSQRTAEFSDSGLKPPRAYVDFRRLLEDRDVDAVSLATPNHWHALGTVWACQAGKDVYVEKPVSHNIWEGRRMVEAARRYGRVVQAGHQNRSSPSVQEAIGLLAGGDLGEVYMARGLCFKWRDTIGKTPPEAVPRGVDYDLWLGPAPRRPFSANRFHYNWHWHWDYGNGDIGNQGVHQLDVARWGLGLDQHPIRVSASGAHVMFDDDQETPNLLRVDFEYPPAVGNPSTRTILSFEVRHWISNSEGGLGQDGNGIGVFFYGSDGYLEVGGDFSYRAYLGRDRWLGPGDQVAGDHYANFVGAVRARDSKLLNCEVEEGHKSAVLAHLANISYRLGRSLEFDPDGERFVGDDEANSMLAGNYRPPFEIEKEMSWRR